MKNTIWLVTALLIVVCSSSAIADVFDGQGDNQRGDLGYYYAMTGGKFPTGTTPPAEPSAF